MLHYKNAEKSLKLSVATRYRRVKGGSQRRSEPPIETHGDRVWCVVTCGGELGARGHSVLTTNTSTYMLVRDVFTER